LVNPALEGINQKQCRAGLHSDAPTGAELPSGRAPPHPAKNGPSADPNSDAWRVVSPTGRQVV